MALASRLFVLLALALVAEGSLQTPVIAIWAPPSYYDINIKDHTYVAASYVKWIEAGGAQVVILGSMWDEKRQFDVLDKANGLLIVGGSTPYQGNSRYGRNLEKVLYHIMEKNDNGNYFPVWATCLGFEEMLYFLSGRNPKIITECSGQENVQLGLNLTTYGRTESKMLSLASPEIMEAIPTKVNMNNHIHCADYANFVENFEYVPINIIATNTYDGNKRYISAFEHKVYPFFSTQFHPEKSVFEWNPSLNVKHTWDAVNVALYYSRFFVEMAKKSPQSFDSQEELEAALIYNYSTEYKPNDPSIPFTTIYLFPYY